MTRRPSTLLALVVFAAGSAAAGCDGSSSPNVDGGPVDKPGGNIGEAGMVRLDGSATEVRSFEALPDRPPPPAPNMDSKAIATGRARLVGTHLDACSNGPLMAGVDRYCAFTKPNAVIGRTDLWVMNMTKALAGTIPKCDGTDVNCKLITSNLWTGQPMGGPSHPTTHRFDGDTLVFHANASAALDPYAGPIFAWRPGWPDPKQISGNQAYTCSVHFNADAFVCIENLSMDQTMPLQFDLTAGKVSTANAMPTVLQKIFPTRPNTQSSQWRVSFSRTGDYIAWSTGGATVAQAETIYISKFDAIGTPAMRTMIGPNVSRWSLSADGTKIYYLKNYNYSTMGDPAGKLAMADFPSGANEVLLVDQNVGAFQVLADGMTDKGIGFFDNVAAGHASYKIIPDRANKATVVSVVNGIGGVLAITRDLKLLYYFREVDPQNGTTDGYIAKTDGSELMTGGCTLTSGTLSDQFGAPLTPNGSMVMWADNIDPIDGVGEGWVANPAGCGSKRKWSDRVDFWFLFGNDGMVFSDEGEADFATLKYQTFPGGTAMGTPTVIQKQVSRIYALMPAFESVLFIVAGAPIETDGVYSYAMLPFKLPATDGGAF